ncbi:sugar porter family MFS transporter [Aspergillus undulatus]|uniref:sugar porter family MFS transporter n=1 Tax=Aspergillus undulatus TaxID=1810928 RepID=UPI003CCCA131
MGAVGDLAPAGDVEISYGKPGFKGLVDEPYLFFLACFASLGGVLFGYDQGVISGVQVMNNFEKQFPDIAGNATLQGWMVSVLTLGAMFGALVNGPIADSLSRRWSILLANGVFLIGSIIQAASVNTPMLFVARFIAGFAVGQLSMVVPLYISEIAPPNLRGGLTALQQGGITAGIMISFWLNYGTQYIGGTGDGQSSAAWRLPLALQCLFSLVLAGGTFWLPYSPRWLVMKDREDEALHTLSRIRRASATDHRVQTELLEIKASALFDRETTAATYPHITSPILLSYARYKSLFVLPYLNKRMTIACLLQLIQQFTGINAIIYYAPQIFTNIGLRGESVNLLATGVVGIINFLCTIPAILFLDYYGRKTLLLVGATGMGIAQLIVATIYAVYRDSWAQHTDAGWAAAVFIWLYIACFAFSIGCINWIIPSEIFPPGVRAQAVGVAIGVNWLSNFIVALITPRMLDTIQFGTFYFFLAFCIFLFIWVYFFVPETKNVRMEQMDNIFGGNQGEVDMLRMADIRGRLGLSSGDKDGKDVKEGDGEGSAHVEVVEKE